MPEHHNAFQRLFRGETSYDFATRWRRWFAISGLIILVGLVSLGVRGLNFSIDFKGGTVWEVPTHASVSEVRSALNGVSGTLGQATIQTLTNAQTHQQTIKVQAAAKTTGDSTLVSKVTNALANVAHVSPNDVQLNDIGPSWGSDITHKAIEGVIVFLIVVTAYIWFRFEAKMAIAALTALLHDILVTVGIYSLSGFTVSPDTVIAFLTILGYSLYDTIVVFDKVQENTKGLASSGKATYTDTVNLSMNQVLARSINTSFVAIIPIMSILVIGAWILGATALEDFGLALFIGLTTGAYSSIFVASPLLALLKEREPRYAQIRERLSNRPAPRMTPASAAASGFAASGPTPAGGPPVPKRRAGATSQAVADAPEVASGEALGAGPVEGATPDAGTADAGAAESALPARTPTPPRPGNRPPPRPRKKTRRR
ncbi:protein translocase subunit SecF [Acidiferrimicrobium sp. IK]|uniref:protein translocase subunit SecF n=1 Tax=Acidiferrimicrobium sp. IK TaxID=2871700 RepID=UPI0021CB32C5|nr:protein translocase subunit SecF [Acidiferrimicrobium sp. IK]MCU4184848.1 protein translocase subunit SecF [Acidiferrimicrobium sp. IK]